jgi:hypothetical protein
MSFRLGMVDLSGWLVNGLWRTLTILNPKTILILDVVDDIVAVWVLAHQRT